MCVFCRYQSDVNSNFNNEEMSDETDSWTIVTKMMLYKEPKKQIKKKNSKNLDSKYWN